MVEDSRPRISEKDEALRKVARDAHFDSCAENHNRMLKGYEYLEIAQAVESHVLTRLKLKNR